MKGVVHRPAGDGLNPLVEIDGSGAQRVQFTNAFQLLAGSQ